jgi:hypothetical protein
MEYSELVTRDDQFLTLRTACDAIFDTSKRLPQQVFRKAFANLYGFEHGVVMSKGFAAFLTQIAKRFGDSAVSYITLDPDPVEYYHKRMGFYGLASFPSSSLKERYLEVMSRDGQADSFRARGGDVGVMWGSSLEWGIFCDRFSWELCVMGSSSPLDEVINPAKGTTIRYMEKQVRGYIEGIYRYKPDVARDFLADLSKNYPALMDGEMSQAPPAVLHKKATDGKSRLFRGVDRQDR